MAKVTQLAKAKKYRVQSARRVSISAIFLALAFAGSLYQYIQSREVTWVTDSFKYVEDYAQSVIGEIGSEPAPTTPASNADHDLSGRVVKIADGDTITIVDDNRQQHKIRLHGIDTPEKGQPYGGAAKRALSKLVSRESVGIKVVDTDRYGRTVGVVYIDGLNVNLEMVKGGLAWWYQRYARNDRQLANAEKEAKSAKIGLWQDANPIPPWEWRRGKR